MNTEVFNTGLLRLANYLESLYANDPESDCAEWCDWLRTMLRSAAVQAGRDMETLRAELEEARREIKRLTARIVQHANEASPYADELAATKSRLQALEDENERLKSRCRVIKADAIHEVEELLNGVWGAVNALGAPNTAHASNDTYQRAYNDAIRDALTEIGKLGGRDPLGAANASA